MNFKGGTATCINTTNLQRGGLKNLEPSTLHKRGAAYERHDERGTRRGRAEGHSKWAISWGIFCNGGYSSATGTTCNCVCPQRRRRGKFGGHSSGRTFFSRLHRDAKRRQGRISPLSRWIDDNLPSAHERSILRSFWLTAEVPA